MNLLTIGNSFSCDAARYLHQIARNDGYTLDVANLMIGGCALDRHYRNMLSEERCYNLDYNGEITGFHVSLKEALLNRSWDVITLQQASHHSFDKDSYYPYITALCQYVKNCCPKAKIYIHETWAYEDGSDRLFNVAKYDSFKNMLSDVVKCYEYVASDIKADGIIRSGELFAKLLDMGIEKIHRDTFHAKLGVGRYALGLLWYQTLTGNDVLENGFSDFDEEISPEEIEKVKTAVASFK